MKLIHGVGREQARNTINTIIVENRLISEIEVKKENGIAAREY